MWQTLEDIFLYFPYGVDWLRSQVLLNRFWLQYSLVTLYLAKFFLTYDRNDPAFYQLMSSSMFRHLAYWTDTISKGMMFCKVLTWMLDSSRLHAMIEWTCRVLVPIRFFVYCRKVEYMPMSLGNTNVLICTYFILDGYLNLEDIWDYPFVLTWCGLWMYYFLQRRAYYDDRVLVDSSRYVRIEYWFHKLEQEMNIDTPEHLFRVLDRLRKGISSHTNEFNRSYEIENLYLGGCMWLCQRFLNIKPYFTQFNAALLMCDNALIEMQTGEGKTIVIVLVTLLKIMIKFRPVIVVTINDYLAKRDYLFAKPIWDYLNLDSQLLLEKDQRRELPNYRKRITYTTNSNLIFDHMYNVYSAEEELVTWNKGEVDLIFDEFDMTIWDNNLFPYIISSDMYIRPNIYILSKCFELAYLLVPEIHFELDEVEDQISLTDKGHEIIYRDLSHLEANNLYIMIDQCLRALYLLKRDIHYVVDKNRIVLLNESTARLEPDKQFQNYLQAALEFKEGISINNSNLPVTNYYYNHFVSGYPFISGASGTSMPYELSNMYSYDTVKVPLYKRSRRVLKPRENFNLKVDMLDRAIEIILDCVRKYLPILVILVDMKMLNLLSDMCTARGLEHECIHALNERSEDLLISKAGLPGSITLSTIMIGRGTDIQLGGNYKVLSKNKLLTEEDRQQLLPYLQIYRNYTLAKSGLVTVIVGTPSSYRIERQISGRSARQGEKGVVYRLSSQEDELILESGVGKYLLRILHTLIGYNYTARILQKSLERRNHVNIGSQFRSNFIFVKYQEDIRALNISMVRLLKVIDTLRPWEQFYFTIAKWFNFKSIYSKNTLTLLAIYKRIHYTLPNREYWRRIKMNLATYSSRCSYWLKDFIMYIDNVKLFSELQMFNHDVMLSNIDYTKEIFVQHIRNILGYLEQAIFFENNLLYAWGYTSGTLGLVSYYRY